MVEVILQPAGQVRLGNRALIGLMKIRKRKEMISGALSAASRRRVGWVCLSLSR
jgi:hypothetical protein